MISNGEKKILYIFVKNNGGGGYRETQDLKHNWNINMNRKANMDMRKQKVACTSQVYKRMDDVVQHGIEHGNDMVNCMPQGMENSKDDIA